MAVKHPASAAMVKKVTLEYEVLWNKIVPMLHKELRSEEDEYEMRELIRHMQLAHERLRHWYQARAGSSKTPGS